MTSAVRPIEVIGGGLAGLSLGLALQRRGVPVTVIEAGDYPRSRVCGEFVSGLSDATIARLGLGQVLATAQPHREVAWYHGGRAMLRHSLPHAAWAISRLELDTRLAGAFRGAGGQLRTRTRGEMTARPGRVNATGRRRTDAPWVGLKTHVRGLELACGLELHLGREAYVGLCALPEGRVNVCGLFRRQSGAGGPDALVAHLRGAGLDALAARVASAEAIPGSGAAVAGLTFGRVPASPGEIPLGDAQRLLPPFFGNGMASAFQMAELALDPLEGWARGKAEWDDTCAAVNRRVRRRFQLRALVGGALHALLLSPSRQRWLGGLARQGVLPTRLLYATLH